ncbi:hypothetical protein GT347_10610 [Xylophilus rhododendri]|uniref:Uncharacterized protein n=1 Tax=Xylophilus rhododendri TaxID=2697032 RepID=A0A857J6F8_9BURK|nr:hypothetical protein [Xylophilus rhododendri]QHI98405.1 hypothetical protein GT347_10610 [Xylophilus rhododendri]
MQEPEGHGAAIALPAIAGQAGCGDFAAPPDNPPRPSFVIAGKRQTQSLYGMGIQQLAHFFGDCSLHALDRGTRRMLQKRQSTQLRRFGEMPPRTLGEMRLLQAIRKPVGLVDLARHRRGAEPLLVVLSGHSGPGSRCLGTTPMRDVAASLQAAGLRDGDVIYLSACFGADSRNTDSTDPAVLADSAAGSQGQGTRLLPAGQHLADALGGLGLGRCAVVAVHNYVETPAHKDLRTRKIRYHAHVGQEYSSTQTPRPRQAIARAARVFRSGRPPSALLADLAAGDRQALAPALGFLDTVTPRQLAAPAAA